MLVAIVLGRSGLRAFRLTGDGRARSHGAWSFTRIPCVLGLGDRTSCSVEWCGGHWRSSKASGQFEDHQALAFELFSAVMRELGVLRPSMRHVDLALRWDASSWGDSLLRFGFRRRTRSALPRARPWCLSQTVRVCSLKPGWLGCVNRVRTRDRGSAARSGRSPRTCQGGPVRLPLPLDACDCRALG